MPERIDMGDDAPSLADGIDTYVDLFRAQPPGGSLAASRLAGDLTAGRFRGGAGKPDLSSFDTVVAAQDRAIPVRVHVPAGANQRSAICYLHGGGFAHGSVESFAIASEALALETGRVVVSVEYRRLPESRFDQAQDDCIQACKWVGRNAVELGAANGPILLAGDSVGACFALNSAIALHDHADELTIGGLLLFYGAFALDPDMSPYCGAQDPLLDETRIAAFVDLFERCGGREWGPTVFQRSSLPPLPPMHIVAAERDPLADDSRRLYEMLQQKGLPASLQIAPGMIHGFLRAIHLSPDAKQQMAEACAQFEESIKIAA